MSDKWALFVDRHFEEVVKYLQPSILLDKLRGADLITREEYSDLRKDKELDRARTLVNDLLPRKGKDSLDKFCSILLKTPGQEHIVKDIIKYEPAIEASRQNEPQRDATASGSCSSSTVTRRPPASHSKDKKRKFATFVFKEEHRESINRRMRNIISCMCHELFGIDKKRVKFEFGDNSGKKGYLCFCDLSNKLVVLKVHGVSPERVENHRSSLIRWIVTFLRQHKVKRRQVHLHLHLQETLEGCSFIILSVDIDSFIDLLCSLGQEEQNGAKELGLAVQRAIPGLQKGNLFLGGLPAIELFSEPLERVQSMQPPFMSFKRLGTICTTLSRKVLVIRPQ